MKSELDMDIMEAVIKMHQMEIDMLPSDDELSKIYQLSASFFNNMERLVKHMRRKEQQGLALRWFAAVAAVVFLLVFATHPQYIAMARDYVMKWYEDHIQFHFKEDTNLNKIPEYELGYVPEGYEPVDETYYKESMGAIEYRCGEKRIIFDYSRSDSEIFIYDENPEYLILKTQDGRDVYYINSEGDDESAMVWLSKDKRIVFSIIGSLEKEEFLKILENIVEK